MALTSFEQLSQSTSLLAVLGGKYNAGEKWRVGPTLFTAAENVPYRGALYTSPAAAGQNTPVSLSGGSDVPVDWVLTRFAAFLGTS